MTIDDTPARFRLVDAMALLAATAVGLAGLRYHFGALLGFTTIVGPGSVAFAPIYPRWSPGSLATATSLMLAAYSPALLWCGWRGGLRGIGTIARRPGLMACAAATVVSAGFLGWHLAAAWSGGWPTDSPPGPGPFGFGGRDAVVQTIGGGRIVNRRDLFALDVLPRLGRRVGPAVLLAWAGLALARRWRGPVGWADRAGVIVGIGWIEVGLVQVALWGQDAPIIRFPGGWTRGPY